MRSSLPSCSNSDCPEGGSTKHILMGQGIVCLLQGADIFCAKINLEVQVASEKAIAAIERNGGVITTSYYDPRSLREY